MMCFFLAPRTYSILFFLQCLSACMNIIEEWKDATGNDQLMSIIYVNVYFEHNCLMMDDAHTCSHS